MKFVAISDMHGKYYRIDLPMADCLIVAGDILSHGIWSEFIDFSDWIASRPNKHKVVIAGNHDRAFEDIEAGRILRSLGVSYLCDSYVELDGVSFWGSPYTPTFGLWSFMKDRGAKIREHWDQIPDGIDVLITHGPPKGHLDYAVNRFNPGGIHCGCEELAMAVNRVKPKVHVFGHIHYSSGEKEHDGTKFINASVVNERYELVNQPKTFEINNPDMSGIHLP